MSFAATQGQANIIHVLASHGGSIQGQLGHAAFRGQAEGLKALIEAGADVDETFDLGPFGMQGSVTALMAASLSGYADCVSVLLMHKADVHKTNLVGDTALLLTAGSKSGEHTTETQLKNILDDDTSNIPRNLPLSVKLLIDYGADVNHVHMSRGKTALMHAVESKNVDVAHILLKSGARVNQASDSGVTALFIAAGIGHIESVQLLLEFGADPYLATHAGMTAIDNAQMRRNTKCFELLAASGAATSLSSWLLTVAFLLLAPCFLYRKEILVWWRRQAQVPPPRRLIRRRNRRNRRNRQQEDQDQQPVQPVAASAPAPTSDPQWWELIHPDHQKALDTIAQDEHPAYICRITLEIMRDPALLVETGNSFEYHALHRWVNTAPSDEDGNKKDPQTSESFSDTTIARNRGLGRQIRAWCEAKVKELNRARLELEAVVDSPQASQWAADGAHIFVDDSNLMAGAQSRPTFDLAKLILVIEGKRKVKERVAIGSKAANAERAEHWQVWEAAKYELSIGTRDPQTNKEVFIDEALQASLAKTAANQYNPSRVLVLVTGDGNQNNGRVRFPEIVEIALRHGWCVEVYSWESRTHGVYKRYSQEYVGFFQLHFLDKIFPSA
jgi:hypothetical protein